MAREEQIRQIIKAALEADSVIMTYNRGQPIQFVGEGSVPRLESPPLIRISSVKQIDPNEWMVGLSARTQFVGAREADDYMEAIVNCLDSIEGEYEVTACVHDSNMNEIKRGETLCVLWMGVFVKQDMN